MFSNLIMLFLLLQYIMDFCVLLFVRINKQTKICFTQEKQHSNWNHTGAIKENTFLFWLTQRPFWIWALISLTLSCCGKDNTIQQRGTTTEQLSGSLEFTWSAEIYSFCRLTLPNNVSSSLLIVQRWGPRWSSWILQDPEWTQRTVQESHTWLSWHWNTRTERKAWLLSVLSL